MEFSFECVEKYSKTRYHRDNFHLYPRYELVHWEKDRLNSTYYHVRIIKSHTSNYTHTPRKKRRTTNSEKASFCESVFGISISCLTWTSHLTARLAFDQILSLMHHYKNDWNRLNLFEKVFHMELDHMKSVYIYLLFSSFIK